MDIREIERSEAIRWLSQYELLNLNSEERSSILLNWWLIDENEPEYFIISDEIKSEMKELEEPLEPELSKYDPLILESLINKYTRVTNSYIQIQLNNIGVKNVIITSDKEEDLVDCLCCGYKTLSERGEYSICAICFWEDDGNSNPEKYSGPNHMTLGDARTNFKKFGACDEGSVNFVDKDRFIKYNYVKINGY